MVLVLAVLLTAGVFAGSAASQAVFAPAKIAFVDVGRVFKDYAKARDIQEQVQKDLLEINKGLAGRVEELKKRRGELELLLPGTPEFRQKQRELDREAFGVEWDEKDQKTALERALVKRMSHVYTEVKTEAENFARRNGLAAVYMVNTHEMGARSQEELQVLIASRPVLYWDKALDITDEVLRVMNGTPAPDEDD
jgi:Skp family chaperone for outer membrane proteins